MREPNLADYEDANSNHTLGASPGKIRLLPLLGTSDTRNLERPETPTTTCAKHKLPCPTLPPHVVPMQFRVCSI